MHGALWSGPTHALLSVSARHDAAGMNKALHDVAELCAASGRGDATHSTTAAAAPQRTRYACALAIAERQHYPDRKAWLERSRQRAGFALELLRAAQMLTLPAPSADQPGQPLERGFQVLGKAIVGAVADGDFAALVPAHAEVAQQCRQRFPRLQLAGDSAPW